MSDSEALDRVSELKRFRSPETVIGRFIARRTWRGALIWAIVFGSYVASKAIGFVDLYPTQAARQKIAESFSNNVGIELMLGRAPHTASTAAYVAWNTGGIMVIIGSIWAFLIATKYFRGEEDAGRQEVLLAGQTTARKAALNIFSGIGISLCVFYIVMAGIFTAIGKSHGVDFNVSSSLFFSLAVLSGITLFVCVGAFVSQLMPTRAQAVGVSATILGICFLLRTAGDITNMHWLLNVTPLGWLEKLQPLSNSQPLWLVPFLVCIVVLGILTIFLAGRRDLGAGIFIDKAVTKPHFGLMNSPLGAAARMIRAHSIGWLTGIFITAVLYGLITKSTAQVFSDSKSFEKALSHLAQQSQLSSALAFLGIVFLLQMILIMAYAASSVAAIRRDEAEGYIDNFLVRPVSRIRWLSGRVFLSLVVILMAGLLTSAGVWIGLASQHVSISYWTILLASINALVPALFVASVGICVFGARPRLTVIAVYGVLAWSFALKTLSSGLNINHWILDSSILTHVTLSPLTAPNWKTNFSILLISITLCGIGMYLFNYRDLEQE